MTGFPLSHNDPIRHLGPPSKQADVVVIGGGVIGVCTALYLAQSGVSVVLLEKGRIAAEQSSRNWGWIRQQGRDPDELGIMVQANRLWRELARETNVDIGLRQGGVVYLASNKKQLSKYAEWLPHANAHGVDTQLLSAAQTHGLIPGMATSVSGALYTRSDMRAEPAVAVPALADIAVRAGAQLVEDCAVRALDVVAGKVAGLLTEAGHITTSRVVLAGGAWSSLFLRNHGVNMPQLSVRATVAATSALPEVFAGGAGNDKVSFRARLDGGYTLAAGGSHDLYLGHDAVRALPKFLTQLRADPFGTRFLPFAPEGYPDAWRTPRRWSGEDISPFERMRVLNPAPNQRDVVRSKQAFSELFPDLPTFEVTTTWAGMIDTMPDLVPVVDHVSQLPGLIIGTGMSGHGFGIGPAMGRILADLAQDEDAGHDLARFRLGRFSDGSRMSLGPAL